MVQETIAHQLDELLKAQRLGVLATVADGHPHCNIVAFAHTEDMRCLLFATSRASHKYTSLVEHAEISMLIDNRGNLPSDFQEALAVTVDGIARDLGGDKARLMGVYLAKHPSLKDFVSDPDCALVCVEVKRYKLVSQFQNVQLVELE
jgi:general stress protein 26